MDFKQLIMLYVGIIFATFLLGLFGWILYRLFPFVFILQDLFIGIFSLLGYHSSSMVTFGSSILGYLCLEGYLFVKSIIS